jgi:hypothetical protein
MADIQERIYAATVQNLEMVASSTKIDGTYKTQWKRYREFVNEKVLIGELPSENGLFLTRAKVDYYFSHVVANLTSLCPSSARRIVSSLQKFADIGEHAHSPERFIVESRTVNQALDCHSTKWAIEQAAKISDPHSGLPTDVITYDEHRKAFDFMIQQRDWRDITWCWSTCRACYLRYHNVHNMLMSRMRLELNSGPRMKNAARDAPCAPCLAYILRKDELAKVKKGEQKTPRIVGGVRHRDPFQCMVGFAAMNLFVTLYSDRCFHFIKTQPLKFWQSRRIITGWSAVKKTGYEAARKAYSIVMKACNIDSNKITHCGRVSGMTEASQEGVHQDTIGSMSKHVTHKIKW